jgi:hypothetical protein
MKATLGRHSVSFMLSNRNRFNQNEKEARASAALLLVFYPFAL